MPAVKSVFNRTEKLTHDRLKSACDHWGADVHSKIRMADVLSLERIGVTSDLRRFVLQAHFDFVIADRDIPQFAVEFDGASHRKLEQIARDQKKNELCRLTEFPLLRINSNWLRPKYRQMDLLTWLTDAWFLEQSFVQAQEDGAVPWDEIFDPAFTMFTTKEPKRSWPMQLSLEGRNQIWRMYRAGRCADPIPSHVIGTDESDNIRAVAWMRISERLGVFVKTGMRNQLFTANVIQAIEEVATCELVERALGVIAGRERPVELTVIDRHLDRFRTECTTLEVACLGDGPKEISYPSK
jgi:hypothetical protein